MEIIECLDGLGLVACERGDHRRAARLFGAAETFGAISSFRRESPEQAFHDRHEATTQAVLGDAAFAAAWAEGQAMTLEQAVSFALAATQPAPSGGRPSTSRAAQPRPGPGDGRDSEPGVDPRMRLLTLREREVAALIARGLTNRDIASQLVVTARTAETHVQNILNKLGFTSRSQIAAWAVECGLRSSSTR